MYRWGNGNNLASDHLFSRYVSKELTDFFKKMTLFLHTKNLIVK